MPIAVASFASMVVFLAVGLPLLFAHGLRGLALGLLASSCAHVCCRVYFLHKLFHGFSYITQATRAVAPVAPAAALVLLARVLESGERTALMAAGEICGFLAVTALLTVMLERSLLREAVSYIRRRRPAMATAAP